MSANRIRVIGVLSRGKRGLILNTRDDALWVVESDQETDEFVGTAVVVEGVTAGFDRLKADWIGVAPAHS